MSIIENVILYSAFFCPFLFTAGIEILLDIYTYTGICLIYLLYPYGYSVGVQGKIRPWYTDADYEQNQVRSLELRTRTGKEACHETAD